LTLILSGPVIEVIHCGSDKAWAAGYRLALMTWAMSLDFEVREAKSREDLARLGDELWGAGGIRAGRSVCVRIAKCTVSAAKRLRGEG
jgi:hypothetical protein